MMWALKRHDRIGQERQWLPLLVCSGSSNALCLSRWRLLFPANCSLQTPNSVSHYQSKNLGYWKLKKN
ncbi:hypothetical protein OIU77_028238 [Salix suchowensis]|uniref:Uncharacterized protein n=1 Tax=Salix suchowensis TaxID=1278906 RepID=A0ABQ9BH55_9ROSI|nr:hypothetical protein OIU77_028238 [Salix suchowensis]